MCFINCVKLPEFDFKATDKLNEKGLPFDSRVVDQFYSQKFMLGESGFPRSDISLFLSTDSEDLKNQIAFRMQEIKQDLPDQDLSNEDMIRLVVDRNVQSAPDFQRWYSQLKDQKFEDYFKSLQASKVDSPEKEVIKFDESEKSE